jgi:hypothetical protein
MPDNLKSGVNKASFYDPEINRSYGWMAAHYGVGVLPARPRKPKDKGTRLAVRCPSWPCSCRQRRLPVHVPFHQEQPYTKPAPNDLTSRRSRPSGN